MQHHIPFYQPPVFKLLAIDPGTNQMGMSIFELDMRAFKVLKIQSWTIYPEKMPNHTGLIEDLHTNPFIKRMKIKDMVGEVLAKEGIHHVAYEAPFMNRLQPSAYGPLVALMTVVHMAVIEYGQGVAFTIFPPLTVKKAIGVAGKKGKEVVMEAIRNIPVLMDGLYRGDCQLDDLDNNAVDSVAVGYAAIELELFKELKLFPL